MGAVETPEKSQTEAAQDSSPTTNALAQSPSDETLLDEAHAKIAALEQKLKSLEEQAVKSVSDRLREVENFLQRKYPYG